MSGAPTGAGPPPGVVGGPLPPDVNEGPLILGLTWMLKSFAFIAFAFRIYVKAYLQKNFWLDDASIILAEIFSLIGAAFLTLEVQDGFGQHAAYLSPQEREGYEKWAIFLELFNFLALCFMRWSVSLFTLRLIPPGKPWYTGIVYLSMFINFAVTMETAISFTLRCTPFAKLYDHNVPGSCYSFHVLQVTFTVGAGLDVLADLVVFLVPVLLVRKLQMDVRKKISVVVVFGIGLLTVVCSICKLVFVAVDPLWKGDLTYDAIKVHFFSIGEECLGIVAACLPALRQLVSGSWDSRRESGGLTSSISRITNQVRRTVLKSGSGSRTSEGTSLRGSTLVTSAPAERLEEEVDMEASEDKDRSEDVAQRVTRYPSDDSISRGNAEYGQDYVTRLAEAKSAHKESAYAVSPP